MADPILSLARPAVLELTAYQSARSLGHTGSVYLDANEAPDGTLNRYPDPQPKALRRRLADLYGASEDQLFLGRGSDDAIDALVRTFCEAGKDAILIFPPTYGVYEVAARIQGAEVRKVPVGLDGPEADAALAAWTPETKLVFLCSPNNPTGKPVPAAVIETLCTRLLGRAIVVLDEAYLEFSTEKTFTSRIGEFPNLVVLRTLSKAWGLAGARCGTAIGNPVLISLLQKVRAPYPLSTPSVDAVWRALSPAGEAACRARIAILVAARAELAAELAKLPDVETVYPSEGNFLLVKVKDAARTIATCLANGIVIRDRSREPGLENCVRITIGTADENARLLQALGAKRQQLPFFTAPVGRTARRERRTKETQIEVEVRLDGPTDVTVKTGIGFFDHMLEQIAKHGGFGLTLGVQGDLHIDEHHTVEDTALALGECLRAALGDKIGIGRYGFVLPMDESEAKVSLDLSGRPYFVFAGQFPRDAVGGLSTEMVPHFFRSLAETLGATLHLEVRGENTHHMVESCFKAVGRALRGAIRRDGSADLPSTKGVL